MPVRIKRDAAPVCVGPSACPCHERGLVTEQVDAHAQTNTNCIVGCGRAARTARIIEADAFAPLHRKLQKPPEEDGVSSAPASR